MKGKMLLTLLLFSICVGCAGHRSSVQKEKDDVATCLAEVKAKRSTRDGFSLQQEEFEWCMRARGYSPDYIQNKWESVQRELEW